MKKVHIGQVRIDLVGKRPKVGNNQLVNGWVVITDQSMIGNDLDGNSPQLPYTEKLTSVFC